MPAQPIQKPSSEGFFVARVIAQQGSAAKFRARVALFGKKDYQQLMVLWRMVQQFAMPIEVMAHETMRAEDRLALFSRNAYLSRGWEPDDMTVRRRSDLQSPVRGEPVVVLGAARLGTTRLIDKLEA